MRRFHTCVCSILHLPPYERRFIEGLIAISRARRRVSEHTDLSIVSHHDGYMIHVGVVEDHAVRPINVPPVLWKLLALALEEGASWLSFDREELPCAGLATYPEDPPPVIGDTAPITIHCKACGGTDVMRDASACWDQAAQAWTLGSVFDAAFCNACEADASLIEMPIAGILAETAA